MVRIIVFLVLLYGAMRAGVIWDSHENPIPNVTVLLEHGTSMNGTLSYTWLGQYHLATNEGTAYIFDSAAIRYESRPIDKERSEWVHWRSFVPVSIVALLWLILILPVEIGSFLRSLNNNSDQPNSREDNA